MAFIHGFILALGLILPLGAQNVFIFNQGAVQRNLLRAMPAVMAAGLSDTLLILLAVLGVSVIVFQFHFIKFALILAGMAFLIYMGISMWRSQEDDAGSREQQAFPPRKQVMFALSVSLLNPHAIMDTVGVIGVNAVQYTGVDRVLFTSATILVSFVWFVFLAVAGKMMRRLGRRVMVGFNKVSAVIMWASAVYLGAQLW
ncbi:MAG: LysE family transporter [Bacillaceae bacterium]|nr:LysE family transporter [Bacillaceae bacterium]